MVKTVYLQSHRSGFFYQGLLFSLLLLGQNVFAQYEDFVDAPTKAQEQQGTQCTIEGVQFEKKVGITPDAKDLSIVFLLTQKPSAFFYYYDQIKKAVVFDFYDTKIGESPMEPIREHPVSGSKIEQFKLDLNKEIAGLRPDFRDVVRVTLFSIYDFDYDVQEEESVITMRFKWNRKIEKQFTRSKNSVYWKVPLALASLGGAGFFVYKFVEPQPTNTNKDWLPDSPPAYPQ